MKTYRKAEAIVTQYNQDLAEWEQAVKNGQKPAEKQNRPPERQSVRNRLRQLQEEGKQNSQPKQRKKSQDRDRVPSRVMRKLVCRLWLNEVSRQ